MINWLTAPYPLFQLLSRSHSCWIFGPASWSIRPRFLRFLLSEHDPSTAEDCLPLRWSTHSSPDRGKSANQHLQTTNYLYTFSAGPPNWTKCLFLFKSSSHGYYTWRNSNSWVCRDTLGVLNIRTFMSMQGLCLSQSRQYLLYFPPFYCLYSPFPPASMHQFYCRAQRWREPRREVVQMRGRGPDKEGVKWLGVYQDKARRVMTIKFK